LFPSLHVGRRLIGPMALALGYAAAVMLAVSLSAAGKWEGGDEVATILGMALGILVVFRTNAANGRWWEARKLWGQLINDLRNLALKAQAHAAVDDEEHRRFAGLLVGFADALRSHLRGEGGCPPLPGFEPPPPSFPHAPGYVAGLVHRTLDHWNRQAKLKDTVWVLDHHARALMDICGACERIRNTPLASSYRALVRWGIALYILISPWAVALELGWAGLPALAIGFGFLMGTELTAEVVEEPFGREPDDLPLESYCRTIETFIVAVVNGKGKNN
jgi:putative membrane protein